MHQHSRRGRVCEDRPHNVQTGSSCAAAALCTALQKLLSYWADFIATQTHSVSHFISSNPQAEDKHFEWNIGKPGLSDLPTNFVTSHLQVW